MASGRLPASAAERAWFRLLAAKASFRFSLLQTTHPTTARSSTAMAAPTSSLVRSRYQGVGLVGVAVVCPRVVASTIVAMSLSRVKS